MDKITTTTQGKDARRADHHVNRHDHPTALLLDQSGIDMILVGDLLGMVVHGLETTLPVTMDMMSHCCAAGGVGRAGDGDMPFMIPVGHR